MKEQIVNNLLNGMEIDFFLTMLIAAFAGVLVFFLTDVVEAVYIDNRTPRSWNWKLFAKGTIRIVVGIIVLVISIIWFGDLSKMVFQIQEPLEMNGLVAFFLGMSIDAVVKKVLGFGKGANILMKKK